MQAWACSSLFHKIWAVAPAPWERARGGHKKLGKLTASTAFVGAPWEESSKEEGSAEASFKVGNKEESKQSLPSY